MTTKEIIFNISRYKPGVIDPPQLYAYTVPVTENMSVLDSLEHIRLAQDHTLMYRHSCHHSACGTCACIINGSERLACTTNVWNLNSTTVTIEPLKGFARIGDLVVSMDAFFQDISEEWTHLKPSKDSDANTNSRPSRSFIRFENCIECGSCISACPVSQRNDTFMGPAALAALHREFRKAPLKKESLLRLAAGKRGERWCKRALACSRVCPTAVYPARHIADLRRMIKDRQTG